MVALGFESCYKDTSYNTTYTLRPYEQLESSGDYLSLAGTNSFAFEGSSDELYIDSYEDAVAGIATSVTTGEKIGPYAWSSPSAQSESEICMSLDRIYSFLVVVEPSTGVYAYSDYEIPHNLYEVYVDIVFRSWKDSSYTASTWTFIVPESEEEEEE